MFKIYAIKWWWWCWTMQYSAAE